MLLLLLEFITQTDPPLLVHAVAVAAVAAVSVAGLAVLTAGKRKKTMRVVFNSFFTLFVLSLFSPSFYLRR